MTEAFELAIFDRGSSSEVDTDWMPVAVDERFWSKVEKTDDCWLWTASTWGHGYGLFRAEGRSVQAHRWSYEALVGPIPAGLHIDHLCRVRNCVNPAHLEPVTPSENTRRGIAGQVAAARMRARTHCPQGHPYDAENTYHYLSALGGQARGCKACRAMNSLAFQRKGKEPRSCADCGGDFYPFRPTSIRCRYCNAAKQGV